MYQGVLPAALGSGLGFPALKSGPRPAEGAVTVTPASVSDSSDTERVSAGLRPPRVVQDPPWHQRCSSGVPGVYVLVVVQQEGVPGQGREEYPGRTTRARYTPARRE